ncbi:MAG: hypothetical protein RMK99_15300, partial [Anaerolineales bacterium]|nr:hypothetical protein [Anaerolineales bacterium]
LQADGCDPERSPTFCRALLEPLQADRAYVLLTWMLVGVPGAWLAALAYRLARRFGATNALSVSAALALSFGTALFPYSTVFTNHVPAAAALFGALYLLLTRPQPTRGMLALAGFAASLGAALDLSGGLFGLLLGAWVLWRRRAQFVWFAVGGLVPSLLSVALNFQIVGNPLPPQMYTAGYRFPGSEFEATVAGNRPSEDIGRYAFDLLFGARGVFLFFPILLWAVAASLRAMLVGRGVMRELAWVVGLGATLYTLYFIFSTNNFGGYAFSPRWLLIPATLLSAFALIQPELYRAMFTRLLLVALSLFSAAMAVIGALNVWSPAFPPLYVAVASPRPFAPPPIAAAGYVDEYKFGDELRLRLGGNGLRPRWFDAGQGLVAPAGRAWWVLGPEARLWPEAAARLALPAQGPFVIGEDRAAQLERWQSELSDCAGELAAPLPAAFGRELTLLGMCAKREPAMLTVTTLWRVEAQPAYRAERKVFVHLVNANGQIVTQSDTFAARYDSLRTGDRLFQQQRLALPDSLPGELQLVLGVYDPRTGQRLTLPDGADALGLLINP